MIQQKPACLTIRPWLKANLGNRCLGVLTGTDNKALNAAVQILTLLAYDNDPSVIDAFGVIVRRMQSTAQHLAYHAIAHVFDWSDRSRIWRAANLDDCHPSRCAHEPKSDEARLQKVED